MSANAPTFAEAIAATQTRINQTLGTDCEIQVHYSLTDALIQVILQVDAQKFRKELQYRKEEVLEHCNLSGFILFLAQCGDTPIGIAYGYDDKRAGGFFLDTLASMFEGRGVGHTLATLVAIHALSKGHTQVNLYTEERDEKGRQLRKFYEKMGFKYLGTEEGRGDVMKLSITPELTRELYAKYILYNPIKG